MKRILTACVAAWAALGCTTRDGATTLDAFARARRTRPAIVETVDGGSARIDPLTQVRFQRKSGAWTAPVYAFDLSVGPRGIFREGSVALTTADAAEVTGLDEDHRKLLRAAAARAGTAIADRGDVVRLDGPSASRALVHFLAAVGHARRGSEAPLVGLCAGPRDPYPTCDSGLTLDAATDVQLAFAASPFRRFDTRVLGAWTFIASGQAARPVSGDDLYTLLGSPRFTVIDDGIAWDDIQACEIESLSGGRTVLGLASLGVLAVLLAPVAFAGGAIAGRGRSIEPVALPDPDVRSDPHAHGEPRDGEDLAGGREIPAGGGAQPLFTGNAIRKEWIRFGGTFDFSFDTLGFQRISQTVVPTVHFFGDIVEIGGGVRIVKSKEANGLDSSTLGVFRLGFHGGIGARRRFAVPVVFELGEGGDVSFTTRLDYGVRYYLGDGRNEIALTLFPLSPVWEARARHPSRWGVASGVGVLLAF